VEQFRREGRGLHGDVFSLCVASAPALGIVIDFLYAPTVTLCTPGYHHGQPSRLPDEGNRAKCQKHGLSIAQIEALFTHSPRIAPDAKHSADEDRLIAVGRIAGRPAFLTFTIRVPVFVAFTRSGQTSAVSSVP
jgi:uncharacterized DUF497 family protein